MNMNQWLAVLGLLGFVLMFGRAQPAEAHDADGRAAGECSCGCVVLPPTDDEDVARIYATALIVSTYIQVEGGNATVNEIQTLTEQTEDALR